MEKNLSLRVTRDLHRNLKVQAAKEERSLAELVEKALRQYLTRMEAAGNRKERST